MHTSSFSTPAPLKRKALQYMQSALGLTPIPKWYANAKGLSGAIVLMYHSVADADRSQWLDPRNHMTPQCFERHAEYLARYRKVISLTELLDHLESDKEIPRGTVVITFDDGYLDNLEHAFPILERFGLPATVFLPTAYIDTAECQWIDRLYSTFKYRTAHTLTTAWDANPETWMLTDDSACISAYSELCKRLIRASYDERNEILRLVAHELRPARALPRLTMNWDEIRLAAERYAGIEFGSHTKTHIDVTAHDNEVVYEELCASKQRLEQILQKPTRHFSFPYNRVSDAATKMLQSLDFTGAVADGELVRIGRHSQRFSLPRFEAPHSIGLLAFVTSGAYPDLSKAITGRA